MPVVKNSWSEWSIHRLHVCLLTISSINQRVTVKNTMSLRLYHRSIRLVYHCGIFADSNLHYSIRVSDGSIVMARVLSEPLIELGLPASASQACFLLLLTLYPVVSRWRFHQVLNRCPIGFSACSCNGQRQDKLELITRAEISHHVLNPYVHNRVPTTLHFYQLLFEFFSLSSRFLVVWLS